LEVIRQKPSIVNDHKDGKWLAEVHGNIEFKEVTFSYPSRPDVIIFRDFSLFFPAGKMVAVVGGSGSGKSTVVAHVEDVNGANARLIAAAPDLAEAVRELLATHPAAYREPRKIDNRTDNAIRIARAAIAKAEGAS